MSLFGCYQISYAHSPAYEFYEVESRTVIAEIFVHDLISYFSYFRLKVRNLVAYENHARITVYATPSSLYENL